MVNFKTEHPGWLKISIKTDPMILEPLSAFLFELGCTGIASEDIDEMQLFAYIPLPADLEDIRQRFDLFAARLLEIFPGSSRPSLEMSRIEDENWENNWKRFFRPKEVTPELLILPAWEQVNEDYKKRIIRIDPGPAFGTGQHATTSMCLRAIELIHKDEDWNMLDVGTGSGILAIYGAMLGATHVKAIDIDPEALRWADRNIRLNEPGCPIELSSDPLSEIREEFTLVAANLILSEIQKLFGSFERVVSIGGSIIISGILRDQEEVVEGLLRGQFIKRKSLYEEEWACIIAER